MIDLSVIVVSFETAGLLADCLDALEAARDVHPELRFEVIVVDNGSRDASVATARGHRLAPRVVAGRRNRGFAVAVNRGLRLRRGRHVLLLNSDVRVDPDLLVGAVGILDGDATVGVLGPALFHSDGRSQRSVHRLPSLWTECWPFREFSGAPSASPALTSPAGPSSPEGAARTFSSLRTVEAIRGAVFFVRGDVVEKVGPFDEGYFFFLEETDYCARVARAGHRVAYCSELRALHQLGASSKRRVPLATRIEYHRSLYRFLARRSGPAAAGLARSLRGFRNFVTVALLAAPALVLPKVRRRLRERAGLLLWHLRGCPAEPDLAGALSAAPIRGALDPHPTPLDSVREES